MSNLLNFRRTHVKRSTGDVVGVVDRSEGKVFFAYAANEGVYSLKVEDFNKRFYAL